MTIIHTGDFHNRLGEAEAAKLSALRDANPGALLLDAGDAVGAGNLGFRPGGEPILERMAALEYTAMAMGNREAHIWQRILEIKLKSARFPVLSANLQTPRPLEQVQPFLETEADGYRIGIVGVTVPMITKQMWTRRLCDLLFLDPLQTAREMAATLRSRVDLLILLSHMGERMDREAARIGDYDLILGGHSHIRTREPEQVGRAWLCHTGSNARWAGVWHLERRRHGWNATGGLEPLRSDTAK